MRRGAIAAEAAAFFQVVNDRREFPQPSPERLLDKPGVPLLAVCNARLLELAKERVAGSAGTRVMVGKVPVYLGGSRSRSVDVLKESAIGELGVTAVGLVFHSSARSDEVPLSKITGVDVMLDGFSLSVQGRKRPVTFLVSNGLLWGMLVKNLVGGLETDGRRLPEGAQLIPM